MEKALIWLHVVGNIVWIGSILAVGVVILGSFADPKARGEAALAIYRRLSVPAFVVSFVFGATRLFLDPGFYLKQHHWMHAKLPVAFAVIALHHVVGARAKKLARGTVQDPGPTAILTVAIAALAALAAFLVIFQIPN
jgi:protoporphyrinogen IX oxidase